MPDMPSGTVTFLFTDIESSTRSWEAHPDAMAVAIARHDEILTDAVGDASGRVVKGTGDGMMAVFDRASDAAQAAVTAQTQFQTEDFASVGKLGVRMSIHTGEAHERQGDYFGPTVNRAARLMAVGHGGQVLVSATARDSMIDALPGETRLISLGEHRLKDLARPEQVLQLGHPRLRTEFSPLTSLDAFPNNLPSLVASFIGREEDVARIAGLLVERRLTTLTGTGGAGKTRLAMEVGAEAVAEFAWGVWMVQLAPIDDPELVGTAVASAVGIEPQPGRPILDTLRERLAERELLLILDNCEHVMEAASAISTAVLDGCPGVHVLATSRERLGIPVESVELVKPLTVPTSTPSSIGELLGYESARLFVERAEAASPGFVMTDSLLEPVARISATLEGLPLAIELAAARTRVLTADQIADRLDEQLSLLSGYAAAEERHRALRVAIDWSYELLDDDERRLFRLLSTFRGGATYEALEATSEGLIEGELLDLIDSLVSKSVLTTDPTPQGMRYRLLESLRQYAAEKLEELGEQNDAVARHWKWFEEFAGEAEPKVRGPEQLEWLARVEADHDNLRVALDRAYEQGETDICISIVASMCWFWFLHSHVEDWDRWLPRLHLASKSREPRLRSRLLLGTAQYSWEMGRLDQAKSFLRELLAVAEEMESESLKGWAHAYLALTYQFEQRYDRVESHGAQAVTHFQAKGNPAGLGFATWVLQASKLWRYTFGEPHTQDELEALRQTCEATVAGARQIADRNLLGHTLALLGECRRLAGDLDEAQEVTSEAVLALNELGNQYCLGHNLLYACAIPITRGDSQKAAVLLSAADSLRERLGVRWNQLEAAARDNLLEQIQAALDPETLERCLGEGSRLSLEAAVALAVTPP